MTLKQTAKGTELLNIVICEAMKEITAQIHKKTAGVVTEMKKVYEDASTLQGTFKTDNNKEGMFSFCKSMAPTFVVIVNE